MDIFLSIIIGIVIILFLITIHELGHFLISKLFKVYVYEFAIGFGPKIFSWQPKETKYSIRLIPFGGYVYTASKYNDAPKDQENIVIEDKRYFESVKFYKKVFIIIAGVGINFLCGALLLTFGFLASGYSPSDNFGYGENLITQKGCASNQILKKVKNDKNFNQDLNKYPIYIKELKTTNLKNNIDLNLYSNNKMLNYMNSVPKIHKFLKIKKDQPELVVNIYFAQYDYKNQDLNQNSKGIITNKITYTFDKSSKKYKNTNYYLIGLKEPNYYFASRLNGYVYGWKTTLQYSELIFVSIGHLFSGNLNGFVGPVGIVDQLKNILINDPIFLFVFTALISINLAILNVIIIPPLDGYRLLEAIIEKIIKKPLPEKLKLFLCFLGIILFLGLFIFLTISDIIGV